VGTVPPPSIMDICPHLGFGGESRLQCVCYDETRRLVSLFWDAFLSRSNDLHHDVVYRWNLVRPAKRERARDANRMDCEGDRIRENRRNLDDLTFTSPY
jgi:hypothetical protein